MAKYEVLFLVDSGIGNALEALYAIEYCLQQNISCSIFLNKVSASFQDYVRARYGENVILNDLDGITTRHLVHSFTYQDEIRIEFEFYHYVYPDFHSTRVLSETEQYLSIVKGLYPSSFNSNTLGRLSADYSERLKSLDIESKYVLYPGGSFLNSVKRWPYYLQLIEKLGEDKVIVVGGRDDLKFNKSWIYPFPFSSLPQPFLNRRKFWEFLKMIGLLKPHAHLKGIGEKPYAFFNLFSWAELVALFMNCKGFIGNDGGLTHLAAAGGAKGIVIFGPTSVNKNKPYNLSIHPLSGQFPCQPCQFGVNGIMMSKFFINCPYYVKCLYSIDVKEIIDKLMITE